MNKFKKTDQCKIEYTNFYRKKRGDLVFKEKKIKILKLINVK